jgi:hypothetical protein
MCLIALWHVARLAHIPHESRCGIDQAVHNRFHYSLRTPQASGGKTTTTPIGTYLKFDTVTSIKGTATLYPAYLVKYRAPYNPFGSLGTLAAFSALAALGKR